MFFLARNAKTCDHFAQFLARGDMAEAGVGDLLQVEQGQALGEELAVDDALAEAGDDPEPDATGKLVERCTDAL